MYACVCVCVGVCDFLIGGASLHFGPHNHSSAHDDVMWGWLSGRAPRLALSIPLLPVRGQFNLSYS